MYVKIQCTKQHKTSISGCLQTQIVILSLAFPRDPDICPKVNSASEPMANFLPAQRQKRCHSLVLSGFFWCKLTTSRRKEAELKPFIVLLSFMCITIYLNLVDFDDENFSGVIHELK